MNVGELIEVLQALNPRDEVGVSTECCGCSSTKIEIERGHSSVWIVGAR